MLLKSLFSCLIIFVSVFAFATPSARRHPRESSDMARMRYYQEGILDVKPMGRTPWDMANRLDKVDFSAVTDVGSVQKLNQIFKYIRDTKFITMPSQPLKERRLSWMYPDDGCYIRAELAQYFTHQQKMPDTYKIFSFGNLAVKSVNAHGGVVRWWYHVVPVYRVGQQAYAIDPAIDPRGPMTVEEWKKAQEADGPVDKFAVCKPKTVGPDEDCMNPHGQSFDYTLAEQKGFLNQEWNRLVQLGRNPQAELGDSPPWR